MDQFAVAVEGAPGTKGRVFQGALVGYIRAGRLYPQPSDNIRPVMAVYASTEVQSRFLTANLQTGRKIQFASAIGERGATTMEFLKSAGYVFSHQRFDGLVATTAFLPAFFQRDPGMVDPTGIRCIVAAPKDWCTEHVKTLPPVEVLVDHVVRCRKMNRALRERTDRFDAARKTLLPQLAPVASLVMAYLDPRTRAPIIQDPRFHLQLLVAMLDTTCHMAEIAADGSYSHNDAWGTAEAQSLRVYNGDALKLAPVVGISAAHSQFQELLAQEVTRYYSAVS